MRFFGLGFLGGIRTPLGPESNPKTVSLFLANSVSYGIGEFRFTFRIKIAEINYIPRFSEIV